MLSFFRRKKPEDAPQGESPKTQHYSAEELAAAFPTARPAPADAPVTAEPPRAAEPEFVAEAAAPATVNPVAAPAAPVAAPAAAPPLAVPAPVSVPVPAAPVVAPQAPPPAPSHAPTPAAAATSSAERAPENFLEEALAAAAVLAPIAPVTRAPEPAAPAADLPVLVDAAPAPAGKSGWRDRLRNSTFARSFGGLFSRNPKLDDDLLDEIETALITADVGMTATTTLVDSLRRRMKSREFADAQALLKALRADLIGILKPVSRPLVIDRSAKPFVILTVGVNGVGKTTTIGKLAKRFKDEGNSLMLAAGDTFRAAAVAQLQAWGERNGVAVVAQGQNADAASVAFDALQAGKARGTTVLIADTAGRLHTQSGLMNELGKIRRVLGKIDPAAPHEVLMVIDGTTGQNALSQLRQFNAAVKVTGLVVTKLDGTAKGGVVFALAQEFGIPIRFAGIGERPEDLRVFDPEAFVDALLPEALGSA